LPSKEAPVCRSTSGRFADTFGDQLVDRIAILPGQLTAYDSGSPENGTVPLVQLRTHVEAWIEDYSSER